MSKQDQIDAFRLKNERRRLHKFDDGADEARELRQQGMTRRVKTTIPMDEGEDIVETDDVVGTPGAFGNATRQEWNDRIPGTSGVER